MTGAYIWKVCCNCKDRVCGQGWMVQVCRTVELFFFSSRRRHTRLQGDWSSDVCSSDLETAREALEFLVRAIEAAGIRPGEDVSIAMDVAATQLLTPQGDYFLRRESRTLDRRGAWRGRGEISVGAGSLKKKKKNQK